MKLEQNEVKYNPEEMFWFEVMGFNKDSSRIIFRTLDENKIHFLHATLRNNELMGFLGIEPKNITKQLKNYILERATEKGRVVKVYSCEGIAWHTYPEGSYSKWISADEAESIPLFGMKDREKAREKIESR